MNSLATWTGITPGKGVIDGFYSDYIMTGVLSTIFGFKKQK